MKKFLKFHPTLCSVAHSDRARMGTFCVSTNAQNSYMSAIPSNLCILTEQLEDDCQFHDVAAQQETGERRERHRDRSLAYAAMLSQITKWELRNDPPDESLDSDAVAGGLGHDTCHTDGYAALLERICCIHRAAIPARQTIRIRAANDATDGTARDDRRHAGELVHC